MTYRPHRSRLLATCRYEHTVTMSCLVIHPTLGKHLSVTPEQTVAELVYQQFGSDNTVLYIPVGLKR